MKYIIMCGGNYTLWQTPKHLTSLGKETIVERTIRLLRENGITDIAISSNNPIFKQFDVEFIEITETHTLDHRKGYVSGHWMTGFYKTDEPVCYLFGDVIFSKYAIKTIVETETDDVEFFASAPPFSHIYPKPYAEPFGFKVVNQKHFQESIKKALDWNGWKREPVSWELWQVVKDTPYNHIDYTNYTAINDFTCDVDRPDEDLSATLRCIAEESLPTKYMIHAYPKRMWYVENYLIPSMLAQGIEEVNITIYNDSEGAGNLRACMNAFASCKGDGGTWHLQDDVLICKDFKKRTEQYDFGLVCGFSSEMYDGKDKPKGTTKRMGMWFSFPCMRIPNQYARDCAEWVNNYIIGNPIYRAYWEKGVNDDWAFRTYLKEFHRADKALNIVPNLVTHIDYLIGGGSGNKGKRKQPVTAQYWDDDDLVEELKRKLEVSRET